MEADWQPIETAPKDGQEILLWTEHGGCWLVYWEKDDDAFLITNGKESFHPRGGAPTHWRPLPAPPAGWLWR